MGTKTSMGKGRCGGFCACSTICGAILGFITLILCIVAVAYPGVRTSTQTLKLSSTCKTTNTQGVWAQCQETTGCSQTVAGVKISADSPWACSVYTKCSDNFFNASASTSVSLKCLKGSVPSEITIPQGLLTLGVILCGLAVIFNILACCCCPRCMCCFTAFLYFLAGTFFLAGVPYITGKTYWKPADSSGV